MTHWQLFSEGFRPCLFLTDKCKHSPLQLLMSLHRINHFDFSLCASLLPFPLPAVERSISPRKCISLRELQTTRRMPTVCSPSTSHFSLRNRCILSSFFFSLRFCQPKSSSYPGATTPLPPAPPPLSFNQEWTVFSVAPFSPLLYAGIPPS